VKEDRVREGGSVIQSKNRKPVQFELIENTRDRVSAWVKSSEMFAYQLMSQAASMTARISHRGNTVGSSEVGWHRLGWNRAPMALIHSAGPRLRKSVAKRATDPLYSFCLGLLNPASLQT